MMAVERKFVAEGTRRARVEKHLVKGAEKGRVWRDGPAEDPPGHPGHYLCRKTGYRHRERRETCTAAHSGSCHTISVSSLLRLKSSRLPNPSFNAQIMAERLANALERGWYFRKAGSSIIRRVMESGALGCEVIIAGKLTGSRARTQKFTEGYIKHSGEPVNTIVEKGYAVAIKKLGVIGVQVRIIPPDAKLPDHFEMIVPKRKATAKPEIAVTSIGEDIEKRILRWNCDEFDEWKLPEESNGNPSFQRDPATLRCRTAGTDGKAQDRTDPAQREGQRRRFHRESGKNPGTAEDHRPDAD